ncbi:MAG: 50S ribosomal protein L35 [Candidatus Atribacteria bacterium]|nr:50S ribosomal protein L35 [Candidatus Atribacteria bacterium]
MPKMKTHRALAKRVKITAKGKIKMNHSGKSHLLACKEKDRKRRLRKAVMANSTLTKKVKRLLPYAF